MRSHPWFKLAVALVLILVAVSLAGCGGGQPAPQADPTPTAMPPATAAAAEPTVEQTATASTALNIPCTELVPDDELQRLLGAKPDSLSDTVMPGWTACTWYYTPPNATDQAEFIVQAYTGEETLVKWRMDTAKQPAGTVVNSLADYVQEGYTWVLPESKLRAVQALQDGRYLFLRFPSDNLALGTESTIADYLNVLFNRLQAKG